MCHSNPHECPVYNLAVLSSGILWKLVFLTHISESLLALVLLLYHIRFCASNHLSKSSQMFWAFQCYASLRRISTYSEVVSSVSHLWEGLSLTWNPRKRSWHVCNSSENATAGCHPDASQVNTSTLDRNDALTPQPDAWFFSLPVDHNQSPTCGQAGSEFRDCNRPFYTL